MDKPRSWKNVFQYVKESASADNLSIVAPGIAFYLMLGLIPGIAALISIYGLVADPAQVQEHFEGISGGMPDEAAELLSSQMARIAEDQGTAGLGALIGIAVALWAASQAVSALMQGLNIAYECPEKRGTIKLISVRLALTIVAVLFGLLAIGVIVVLPPVLDALPLPETLASVLSLVRWPLLLLLGIIALAVLYYYGPSRNLHEFRWITWGSAVATLLWVLGSALFSLYVANFADYNETYGALGAVVILLLWLLVTAYVILLGAEIDSALQREARAADDEETARAY
jgi:membrane protein